MLIIPYWGPTDGAQGFLRVSRAILAHVRLKWMGEGPGPSDGPKAPKSSLGPKTPGPWPCLMLHAAYILMLLRSLSVLESLWVCASWIMMQNFG